MTGAPPQAGGPCGGARGVFCRLRVPEGTSGGGLLRSGSVDGEQGSLEIAGPRELGALGVVRCRAEELEEPQPPLRAPGGLEHDPQEGRKLEGSGAGEGREQAPGCNCTHGKGVHVQVASPPAVHLGPARDDLVGVEDHQLRRPPRSRAGSQVVEDVLVEELHGQAGLVGRTGGAVQGDLVEVDGHDPPGPGPGREECKAPCIGAQIEHVSITGQLGDPLPVVALVAEPPRLVPGSGRHGEAKSMLVDPDLSFLLRGEVLVLEALEPSCRAWNAMDHPG